VKASAIVETLKPPSDTQAPIVLWNVARAVALSA
jgi:hypothetical protein